jgi:hypothetical protein
MQDVDRPAHVKALPQPIRRGSPRVQDKPLTIVPRPQELHGIAGHLGRRRDLGQRPAVRAAEAKPAAARGKSSVCEHRPPRPGRPGRVASPPGWRRTPGAATFPRERARHPRGPGHRRGPPPGSARPGRRGRGRGGGPSPRAAPPPPGLEPADIASRGRRPALGTSSSPTSAVSSPAENDGAVRVWIHVQRPARVLPGRPRGPRPAGPPVANRRQQPLLGLGRGHARQGSDLGVRTTQARPGAN